MEKLIEMERAGVAVYVFGPGWLGTYQKDWHITAKKLDDGMNLEISTQGLDLPAAIDDLYERWVSATRGLPNHSLRQIEHKPTPFYRPPAPNKTLDDEIPF